MVFPESGNVPAKASFPPGAEAPGPGQRPFIDVGCARGRTLMDRRTIAVSGVVQGVGFRPFVFGLASRFGLHGFVKNQTGGVLIEVEGDDRSLDQFLAELMSHPPPLAQIDEVSCISRLPRGDPGFRIEASTVE